ncbi:RING/U-box superfamily protein [Striga asiatica]|uniref:RING/U-box superfamily protein n=1 Tax=Striga asiatica TaxID=4170 RepID=A0A5A7R911_STRAF|nr:RING/U-box superfamily protein [Striga asiatica]
MKSEWFEEKGNSSQGNEHANVGSSPLPLRVQDVESLENVGDAEGNDGVADGMVVNVPEDPVLVVGLGPEEEGKRLKGAQDEKGDSNVPVGCALDSRGVAA